MLQTMRSTRRNRLKDATPAAKKKSGGFTFDEHAIFDGAVLIYRTRHSGDVWQFRMYVQAEQRYVRKSLKTRDKEEAANRARREFIAYQAKIQNGEKLFSVTAEELRRLFLESQQKNRLDMGTIREGRFRNLKTHTKHYVDFVGRATKIQNIDRKFFRGYLVFRRKRKSDITLSAVNNESVSIKQMYTFAVDEGLISQTYKPDFNLPTPPPDETRREAFEQEEYVQLTNVSQRWHRLVRENHVKREEEIYYRRILHDFIVLQANFGLRTGELRKLRFGQVKVYDDKEKTARVTIEGAESKTRKGREPRARRGDIFNRIRSYTKFGDDEHFVFSQYDKPKPLTKENLYGYYRKLMVEVQRQYPSFDTSKTLYCLRHYYATISLIAGKNPYEVARFMGTSLAQIEKHYDGVKDRQVSQNLLAHKVKFDKNHEVIIGGEGDR